jgi:isoleucyl-tRNA synthetase
MFDFVKKEEEILVFWKKNKIPKKNLARNKGKKPFVFYEGPPSANGRPGIHHVLGRVFKDVVCRYKVMQGFFVPRKAGWDTHGLPVEIQAEKELEMQSKKDIEKYGVAKFNKRCKEIVWKYKDEWEQITDRIGYWLDMKNPYITYDNDYIESLFSIIKQFWTKGLLYQDVKVVPWCPRCQTALSSHELAQGYKKVKEKSIFVKFLLEDDQKIGNIKVEKNTYFLVWTTTPWTLPGNVAIAANPAIDYCLVKYKKSSLILAKARLKDLFQKGEYKVVKTFKGKQLLNLTYKELPLRGYELKTKLKDIYPDKKVDKLFRVYEGDFVTTEEGTGLVHIAPAFGEDDFRVGRKNNLPIIVTVDESGKITNAVPDIHLIERYVSGHSEINIEDSHSGKTIGFGKFVKEADKDIVESLKENDVLFLEKEHEHDYPFCWRCDTTILYYFHPAHSSWFINTKKIKSKLISNNKKVKWHPKYLKEGRFGNFLEDVRDWNFSRERYWGTPLPIWKCSRCNNVKVIGSKEEFPKNKIPKNEKGEIDYHRPYIDNVFFKCECGGTMERVKEVCDVWFDSGSMPFAQDKWMFTQKNKNNTPQLFPADFICEGVDQTRGWFYTLLAVSSLLDFSSPYKNVLSFAHVLDKHGKKMSKSKGNVVDPWDITKKYGADALRWYFYTINQPWTPKSFDENDIRKILNKFVLTLWNSCIFLTTYSKGQKIPNIVRPKTLLDKWIVSKFYSLVGEAKEGMDKYNIVPVTRAIEDFVINDLSNWYIRRSRSRFQKPANVNDLKEVSNVLGFILFELSKLCAPFVPFLSESIFQVFAKQTRNSAQSVHLSNYPKINKKLINKKLEKEMDSLRKIVAEGLAERNKSGIKVRQPLGELRIDKRISKEYIQLIKEEVNVKKVSFGKTVKLNIKITPELKEEGSLREITRAIQDMRKKSGLRKEDSIEIIFEAQEKIANIFKKNKKIILGETIAQSLVEEQTEDYINQKEIIVDGSLVRLAIKKV